MPTILTRPINVRTTTQSANDRRGERCVIVAGPHILRHVVSPLRCNDLTHDDGVIDTIHPAEDPAWDRSFKINIPPGQPCTGVRPHTSSDQPPLMTTCVRLCPPFAHLARAGAQKYRHSAFSLQHLDLRMALFSRQKNHRRNSFLNRHLRMPLFFRPSLLLMMVTHFPPVLSNSGNRPLSTTRRLRTLIA